MTKVKKIPTPNSLSHSIEITTDTNGQFYIPVIDVRDGDPYRKRAAQIEKDANRGKGSKFFLPTTTWIGFTYNESRKKKK